MPTDHRAVLAKIKRFDQLIAYLRDEMGWPIENGDFEDLTFEYTPEELGIDSASAAKIQEIKRLRPLSPNQPWGIFFIKFEPRKLPVVALRRILSRVALKKRASANSAERAAWAADDLLFISNFGEGDERQISFAHFSQDGRKDDLPTLKVLGWDNLDTPLHLDHVADLLTERLAWPHNDKDVAGWRESWRSAFTLRHREVINTSKTLAVRLAELARALRDRIKTVLAIETENGPVTKLMKAFQQALIHDLDEGGFADMYAQTIAYGLLSARVTNPTANTADGLAVQLPVTNPFLKELMETFLHVGGRRGKAGGPGIDFDELGVSEVVELLDDANMEAVVRDFGDRKPQEDPVIHFYEHFLEEYDKKQKVSRGVFYTPRPVVSYIVRSVDELMRTHLGLEEGLADTTTWADVAKRNQDVRIPDGVDPNHPFVEILDPAVGTGTFLVEVIDLIHGRLVEKWRAQGHGEKKIEALWNEYVPKHLLPRLHGYELLMAPYAIAHLKIGLKLHETGYRFGSPERARIYLTNSLEPAQDFSDRLAFDAPALAHEARDVNSMKRNQRFTVVIGNPPYAGHSANNGPWVSELVDDYYSIDGVGLGERTSKWLQDDYVKFVRLAQYMVSSADVGVVGYITNHGYLDNPTFRGMRSSLLNTFQSIHILDLHGSLKKKEDVPGGGKDENVFEIQPGVAIGVFCRKPGPKHVALHSDLFGSREHKYAWLGTRSVATTDWVECHPAPPFFILHPQDSALRDEYAAYWKITSVFPLNGVGMTTARDHVVIDFEREPLLQRATMFRDSRSSDTALCQELDIPLKKGWNVTAARRLIRKESDLGRFIQGVAYRPFDDRLIFYHDSLVWRTVKTVMRHMLAGPNIGLAVGRAGQVIDQGEWNLAYVTRRITEFNLYRRGGNNLAPLYTYDEGELLSRGGTRSPNLNPVFLRELAQALGPLGAGPQSETDRVTPEDVLNYAYAILHSPDYRRRYAESLKIDFPRLPLTSRVGLFRDLTRLGGELVALHLMESPRLSVALAAYHGSDAPEVEKVWHEGETVWLDKERTCGFRGVREAAWNFQIGGYQVCEKWLKDRKGRTLSKDDTTHYQKIVVAIAETIRIMKEIDEVIEEHGGWPAAFRAGKEARQEPPLRKVAEERRPPYEPGDK